MIKSLCLLIDFFYYNILSIKCVRMHLYKTFMKGEDHVEEFY